MRGGLEIISMRLLRDDICRSFDNLLHFVYSNDNASLTDIKLNKEKEIAGHSKKLLIGKKVVSENEAWEDETRRTSRQ